MSLIQCALQCKYQKEGYCRLENCSTVNSKSTVCPYYKSPDDINGFFKISYTDKSDIIGNTSK